jgi:hypothetical protein
MDLLQFGVYRGASMRAMGLELNHSGTLFRRFWGFDSFEGLPSEDATVGTDVREWARGAFSAAAALGDYSFSSVQSKLLRYIDDPRVTFVRGFYNESLTTGLSRHVRPVLYADIDCDLYVSARDALQWMLGNGLVVSGTVVGYDDIWVSGDAQGEGRAHKEMVAKFGLVLQPLSQQVWVVLSCERCRGAVP